MSDHIIELLNNNPFSTYQDKEKYEDLPASYHNLNFVVDNCLINGVNYDNTINMFVDNISCQLCRYEVSDSFWNKIMSNVKKIMNNETTIF